MSRTNKIILSVLSIIVVALVGLYLAGSAFFDQHFYYNTRIGDVDVSGMTQAEAKSAIDQHLLQTPIVITEQGKEIASLPLGQFAHIENSEDMIAHSFQDQKQSHWVMNSFNDQDYLSEATDYIQIDDQALKNQLEELGISNDNRRPSTDASITYVNGKGHQVQEESQGNQIDFDHLKEQINLSEEVKLEDSYIQPKRRSDDPAIVETMENIDRIAQTQYTLVLEDQEITIGEENIRQWIQLDDQQTINLDQNQIYDFLGEVNQTYSTYAKERPFQSTYSGQVMVQPDKMGWWVNRDVETPRIAEELLQAQDVKREPEIAGTHYGYGLGFGDDYIEIDMNVQKLMVYLDNELVLETDVITGRPGSETVPGAKHVWDMQTNAVLQGYNKHLQTTYATPVNYWMPIDDHAIGIHDASWQSNFGGDTYLYSGSLGCINVPPSVMGHIFSLSYVGMPVAVF